MKLARIGSARLGGGSVKDISHLVSGRLDAVVIVKCLKAAASAATTDDCLKFSMQMTLCDSWYVLHDDERFCCSLNVVGAKNTLS